MVWERLNNTDYRTIAMPQRPVLLLSRTILTQILCYSNLCYYSRRRIAW